MRITVRFLLGLATLFVIVAAPAAAQPAAGDNEVEVVHAFHCELNEGTTEAQVEAVAEQWLKAIKTMPGGAEAKVQVLFPVVVTNTGQFDFQLVIIVPSFADWGKLWDAYNDDSAAAKIDDANQGKFVCPDSAVWETIVVGES
jgi:hypothetical protein